MIELDGLNGLCQSNDSVISISVPVLHAQVYSQVYPEPTNVRGNKFTIESKLSFPKSCSEGPCMQDLLACKARQVSFQSFLNYW